MQNSNSKFEPTTESGNSTKPMLPAAFQKELNILVKANAEYKEQLNKVVAEIERTFGKTPYDVDCDRFIDAYCQGRGHITVKELNFEMLMRCPQNGR